MFSICITYRWLWITNKIPFGEEIPPFGFACFCWSCWFSFMKMEWNINCFVKMLIDIYAFYFFICFCLPSIKEYMFFVSIKNLRFKFFICYTFQQLTKSKAILVPIILGDLFIFKDFILKSKWISNRCHICK